MVASLPESLTGDYGKGPGKIPRRLVGVDKILDFLWAQLRLVHFFLKGGKTAFPSCQVCFTRGDRVFLAKLVFADLSSDKVAGKTKKRRSKQLFPPRLAGRWFRVWRSKALRLSSPNQQPTASRFLQDGPKVTSYKL